MITARGERAIPFPQPPCGARAGVLALRAMTKRLAWLALAGAAVRILAAIPSVVIDPDGSRYLAMARLILEGRIHEALTTPPYSHPLYPMLIAFGQAFVDRPLLIGTLISALLGGAAAVPLHFMARRAWNERVADVAVLLYVFLPEAAILGGSVMTESLFFCLFFSAMAVGWSALERGSWERGSVAGLLAAAAWLTRPEGAYLAPLFLFAAAWHRRRSTIAAAAAMLLTALLASYPYLLFIHGHTGRFSVSASPFSAGLLGLLTGETAAAGYQVSDKSAEEFGEYRYIRDYGRVLGPALYIAKTIVKILFYVLVPFLALGFAFLRRQDFRWGPGSYLLVAAGGYFLPPVLAFVAGTPFGFRYILAPLILLLPVAAVGLLWAAERARHPRALPVALAVICLAMSVRIVKPRRSEKAALARAGRVILEKLGPGRKIAGMAQEIEHYARGEITLLPPGMGFGELEELIEREQVEVIAFYLRDLRNYEPGLLDRMEEMYPRLADLPDPADLDIHPVRVFVTTAPR